MRAWASDVANARDDVRRIGYFGSYARDDAGVGSDVDIVIVVDAAAEPFERRAVAFDATRLPVPADVLVYTTREWAELGSAPGFVSGVEREAVWVVSR